MSDPQIILSGGRITGMGDGTDPSDAATVGQLGGGGATVLPLNGVAVNLDVSGIVLCDPRTKPWEAEHEYNHLAFASATEDAELVFTGKPAAGISGNTEPTWPALGQTIIDGGVRWSMEPYGGPWTAETAYGSGDVIIAIGIAWQAAPGGTSDVTEPDWASVTDPYGSGVILDGDITWTKYSPYGGTWNDATRYGYIVTDDHTAAIGTYVLPTVVGSVIAFLDSDFPATSAASADEEPDWAGETPSSGAYYLDGDILWQETTDDPTLAITGVVAGTFINVVNASGVNDGSLVRLVKEGDVESEFAYWAVSSAANRIISESLGSVDIGGTHSRELIYDTEAERWAVGLVTAP